MRRMVRGELRKLARPLTLVVAVFYVLAVVQGVHGEIEGVRSDQARQQLAAANPCAAYAIPAGPLCDRYLDEDPGRRTFDAADEARVRTRVQEASVVTSPVGSGRAAARALASLPGLLLVAALAAIAFGAEWTQRTVRPLFVHQPRRWRVLLAKALAILTIEVTITALTWLVLAVTGRTTSFNAADVGLAVEARAACSALARAVLPIGLYTALGVLAGQWATTALRAAGAAVAPLVVGLALWRTPALRPFSFLAWISTWMDFRDHAPIHDFVWIGDPTAGARHQVAAAAGLAILAVVAALGALRRSARVDVTV